eukprot:gene7711-9032_t
MATTASETKAVPTTTTTSTTGAKVEAKPVTRSLIVQPDEISAEQPVQPTPAKEDDDTTFEWRKEGQEHGTTTGKDDGEDEQCDEEEEDLKKRGKIDAEDLTTTKKQEVPKAEVVEQKKPKIVDMFSDSPTDDVDDMHVDVSLATKQVNDANAINLTDNWDDTNGYYKYKIGEVVDKYQIYAPIGSGVFSTVVTAKNVETNEDVVVKIIRNRPSMHRSGLKEVEILQKINNISNVKDVQRIHCIAFKDSFTYRNHLCIVFEPMSMSLHALLKKFGKNVGLSMNAVRVYAKQLFMALKHIKSCKILHSDIKPDNIVVNENKNTIKLCDFGSAGEPHESEITPYLKMLKKAEFRSKHFNDNGVFLKEDRDPIDQKLMLTPIEFTKPTKDMLNLLRPQNVVLPEAEIKKVLQLKDLIERCTCLDPEKRITPTEALNHEFLKPY